uniref:CRAL-TRIO domain-containing protein n=1 Tax=Corvus moneduloides TaxID=1196302 RepID=A0A8C3DZ22_CORMO
LAGNPELNINHPYYDVARHGIIQLAGDDSSGRKVIAFSCCRIPHPINSITQGCLSKYLKYTLDQYVENDYMVVYFHYGLKSLNKPSLKWLQTAYKEFDKKYVSKRLSLLFRLSTWAVSFYWLFCCLQVHDETDLFQKSVSIPPP